MKKVILGFLAFFLVAGTAYAAGGSNTIRVKIDNVVSVLVNGKPVQDGQLIDGSTMLPLRAIAESLGVTVDWDNTKKQASIIAPQKPNATTSSGLSLEQLNKIGESVGLVYALDENNQPFRAGSGFILNGMFITNHHVVEGSSSLKIVFGLKETVVPSDYLFDDADKDLAAVKFSGGSSVKLSAAKLTEDEKIYTLSFPATRFAITEGTLVYPEDDNIIFSASTDHGSSGGILVNAEGTVIGVITGGSETSEINYAVPAKILQNEIK